MKEARRKMIDAHVVIDEIHIGQQYMDAFDY